MVLGKFGSFVKKQFIDVIQWPEPEENVLVWRFPMEGYEIQNGASLTVRESQMALFVDEGKVADVFEAGMYKLNTSTLPVLTYLKNWDKLFESPFKSDVYFFNTKLQIGRKWGTSQPITIRDQEFGMVRLRAFGMYAYRIVNPQAFFTQISGVGSEYQCDALEEQLRNVVVTTLSNAFGNAQLPFIDMAANQLLLSQTVTDAMRPAFERYGLALDSFAVENISLPDELQKTLDKRISMGMVGDMNRFMQYQTAESIPLAAQNEGGLAGIGAGLAAGVNMGQMMSNAMTQATAQNPAQIVEQAPAAPVEPTVDAPEVRLQKLKEMLDKGLISQEDYDEVKAAILKQMMG
ncbi:SPFH domain-containing protein [Neisseria sp. Ec49-e6-T10]|uniref:SPFH domain-containing protein n=1 Tax=Neisseria sp. Ec49-e6-T10 TaxID=3140744 RepID=UPI003EB772A7